jgi:predicted GNAT superfamily acetyltransferase
MRSNPESVTIRDINTLAEMRQIEVLQKEIWGVEDLEVFPALALRPLKELGAVLIGAFNNHDLVGFVFGFPGIIDGETVIHSDLLAVKPEFRSLNLGFLLKLAQRDKALSLGVNKITWTFDPLQSRNAHLNFAKLGVTSNRYEIDFYGETTSPLHQGSTDRLWVTWDLKSTRVKDRLAQIAEIEEQVPAEAKTLIVISKDGIPKAEFSTSDATLLIEIPTIEISKPVRHNWRMATREAFTLAIESGYEVREFCRRGPEAGVYVLRRIPSQFDG